MGFYSTFITDHLGGIKLPKWFIEKYKDGFYFGKNYRAEPPYDKDILLVSSKMRRKFYQGAEEEILVDLQKVCKREDIRQLVAVLLHECSGITRIEISPSDIRFSEPTKWKETDGVEHDYCYGCSDLENNKNKPKHTKGEKIIKISILRDGENYAYMEYQEGNNPRVFNNTYGSGGYYDLADVLESVFEAYEGIEIVLTNNL